MVFKLVELTEGVPVQFLGIYATRWPYDSGVDPTVGFIEDEAAESRAAQLEAERDELARKLEQAQHENERLHAELVRVNQQNAQAVINSIRGEP